MDKRKIAFLLIPLLWAASIWGIVGYEEYQLSNGREVILNVVPVDPRDMFRGDYVTLNYSISRIDYYDTSYSDKRPPTTVSLKAGDTVYIELNNDGTLSSKYKYSVNSETFSKPKEYGTLFIKGVVTNVQRLTPLKSMANTRLTVEYGIESYFVPEGTGKDIENRIRTGNVKARIIVDRDGNASIKSLE